MSARQRGHVDREARRRQLEAEFVGEEFDALKVRDKASWRCPEHGVWTATLDRRLYALSDCPRCNRGGQTSTPETVERRAALAPEYIGAVPFELVAVTAEADWQCPRGPPLDRTPAEPPRRQRPLP